MDHKANLQGYWDRFVKTGFYENLGITVPKFEEGISYHDLFDHGLSPYPEAFIPVTFEGEVLAQVNNCARDHASKEVFKKLEMYSVKRMWIHVSSFAEEFPEVLNEDQTEVLEIKDRSEELLALDRGYLEVFYKECFEFWFNHPDLESIRYVE